MAKQTSRVKCGRRKSSHCQNEKQNNLAQQFGVNVGIKD